MKQACKITKPVPWRRCSVPAAVGAITLRQRGLCECDISLLVLRAMAHHGVFEQNHFEISLFRLKHKKKGYLGVKHGVPILHVSASDQSF